MFLEHLAALVPPPLHLLRYRGLLAPHAADRGQIVPSAATARGDDAPAAGRAPGRLAWVRLLARVFRLELRCPACGSPLPIIAIRTDPDSLRTYLDGVGLDSRPPPIAPARLVPEPAFDFAAALQIPSWTPASLHQPGRQPPGPLLRSAQ